MKRRSTYLILLLSLALCSGAQALPVTGLYGHEVAVENQSDAERQRAFREALGAVIVKVTGERRWLENFTLQQAMDNARNYVEAIEYRSTMVQPPTPQTQPDGVLAPAVPGQPRAIQQEFLNVSFARDLVDRLLADAAIPVWDSNRPSVLIWMALQNDAGDRSLLSADSNQQIIDLMLAFARQRGIPIIFPVLDFEDRRNLTADQIWALEEQSIRQASRRYAADSILAGRLHLTATGDLVGLWQFIFQDSVEVFDSLDTDMQSYVHEPLDRITTTLARHFAIVPSRSGQTTAHLRVEGINSLTGYASLVDYLQSLVVVESVTVARLQGPVLELDLLLQGSTQQLYELLTLDRNLVPIEQPGGESQPVLRYRWIQ